MKRLFIPAFFILLMFSACVSPAEYTAHLNTQLKPLPQVESEWLTVKFTSDQNGGHHSETVKNVCVPAILFWYWRRDLSNTLDEYTVCTYLADYIRKSADSLNLRTTLSGRETEITIQQIPNSFIYSRRGHCAIAPVGAAGRTKEILTSTTEDLVAELKFTGNSEPTPAGRFAIKSESLSLNQPYVRFTKWRVTDLYLENYKNELKRLAVELVLNIQKTSSAN